MTAAHACRMKRSALAPTRPSAPQARLVLSAYALRLYPAVTVILAARVLGERLQPSQRVGVTAAIVGVAALAAGS